MNELGNWTPSVKNNGSVLNTLFIFQVEKELNDICNDILNVLDKHLIPCSDTGESKVFYYKMKGDYHRYLAEFATANERKEAAENSLVAYKAASDIALTELATTHPIRYKAIYRVTMVVVHLSVGDSYLGFPLSGGPLLKLRISQQECEPSRL